MDKNIQEILQVMRDKLLLKKKQATKDRKLADKKLKESIDNFIGK